ncbi:MAG: hypothetical protein M1830_001488, partial [Pleopsidium flavum]
TKFLIRSNPIDSTDEVAGIIRLRANVLVSVQHVTSEGPEGDGGYEVDKLRGKRLRLLHGAAAKGMRTQLSDPWVKRVLQSGRWKIKKGQVLLPEYRIHWAGWPSEASEPQWFWESLKISIANFLHDRTTAGSAAKTFIEEYGRKTDPFRDDDGSKEGTLDILDMLYEGDLHVMEAARKGKKARADNRHRKVGAATTVDAEDHVEGEESLHKAQYQKHNLQRRKRKPEQQQVSIISSEDEVMWRPAKAAKSVRMDSASTGQAVQESPLSGECSD